LKNASIIYFSLILALSGCTTTTRCTHVSGSEWEIPTDTDLSPTEFVPVEGGFHIDETSAVNLANNIDELKARNEKLKALINKMKKYYK